LTVGVGGLGPIWDDLGVAESGSLEAVVEQLLARVRDLETALAQRDRRIAELEQRLGLDSSNSSRPPSWDAPWAKQPARKRSSRVRSGRKPGKQPGAASSSRSLVDDPDERVEIQPDRCGSCDASLDGAAE
jgi:transposase